MSMKVSQSAKVLFLISAFAFVLPNLSFLRPHDAGYVENMSVNADHVGNEIVVTGTDGPLKEQRTATFWYVISAGTLLLGFAKLGSDNYFRLREARRLDRQEARDVADRRQREDDVA